MRKHNAKVLGVANVESTDEDEDDASEDEWLPSLSPQSFYFFAKKFENI